MSTDNNYNSKYVDQSWEQMSHLLDKEMPIKKKRRFPFLFIIGSVALLVAAFFIYPLLTNNDTISEPLPLVADNSRINELENPRYKTNLTQTDITRDVKDKLNTEQIDNNKSNNSDITTSVDIENSLSIGTTNILSTKNNKQSKVQTDINLRETINKPLNNGVSSGISKKVISVSPPLMADKHSTISSSSYLYSRSSITSASRSKKLKSTAEERSLTLGLPLPSIEINTLSTTDNRLQHRFSINAITPTLCGPGVNKWGIKIAGVATSNLLWSDRGIGLITRVNYYPMASRPSWSLESGIGIFTHDINKNTSEDLDALKDDMPDMETVDFNTQLDELSTLINSATRQYQLVTNLGISKSWNDRLSLALGVKYKYTLSRNAIELMSPGNTGLSEPDTNFTENAVFRDHFLNPYVAVSYNFTNRFSFRLESDISSLSYSLQSEDPRFSKKTSFIQAELAYRF